MATHDLIIDTDIGGEPPGTPLEYARRLTDAELRAGAAVDEIAWLHAHPLLWLRALTRTVADVELHIGKDRLRLKALRAQEMAAGAERGNAQPPPSAEYLALAAEVHERHGRRQHFLQKAARRLDDVQSLCGADVETPLIGEVVGALAGIAEMAARGAPYTDIHRRALFWAARLERAHGGTQEVPDNSAAMPIRVTVYGLKPTTRLNCRVCYRGKLDPHAPAPHRCPRCRQQHEFDITGKD